MKKMKFEMLNETRVEEMTYDNMHNIIEDEFDLEIASDDVKSDVWDGWIQQGMAFYWVEGDRVPATGDAMEWIIEEVMQLETGYFDNEEHEEYSLPYFDAQQMQFIA